MMNILNKLICNVNRIVFDNYDLSKIDSKFGVDKCGPFYFPVYIYQEK